jgi:hypothetical protein
VLVGADPIELRLGEDFVDPGATAIDPQDGKLAVSADCSSIDPSATGRYACVYRATDSDGNTTSATRTVIVVRSQLPGPRCTIATASPSVHLASGRAVRGGWLNLRALAKDDRIDMGFAWDAWSQVMLYEGEAGHWYGREPEACRA